MKSLLTCGYDGPNKNAFKNPKKELLKKIKGEKKEHRKLMKKQAELQKIRD